jgi:hypothetical protein
MTRARSFLALLAFAVFMLAGVASADTTASTDVDGDGVADAIAVNQVIDGSGPSTLSVTRGSTNETVSIEYGMGLGGGFAGLLGIAELDPNPGAEIIIDTQHITTNEFIDIYTMAGGTLHSAGQFLAYGSDQDYKFGITCKSSPSFTGVVQHSFKENLKTKRWRRTNKRFAWKDGYLVRSGGKSVTKLRGKPKKRETRVGC